MARNLIPIDWEMADELLACGCPGTEIAAFFGMHADTFYDRVLKERGVCFSAYSAEKKATGEALIRKAQYDKALGLSKKGDNTLLIWLGKQRLNQKENVTEEIVAEALTKPFEALMSQLNNLQSDKKPDAHA